LHERQAAHWRHVARSHGSPGELPPDCVFGVTVEDPRLNRPNKRTIPTPTVQVDSDFVAKYDEDICRSFLWNSDIRKEIKEMRFSTADINSLRQANLVPGAAIKLGSYTSHVPLLLCQHRGGGVPCWGSGLEVLLPGGWGRPFWLALVYNGARAGGLREATAAAFECATLPFPLSCPDSQGGADHDGQQEASSVATYFKRPLAKRVNHLSLGIWFPFKAPWKILVQEWTGNADECGSLMEDFFVLRDRNELTKAQWAESSKNWI
jgi:ribonuclease P/MRP protein subunit POP1